MASLLDLAQARLGGLLAPPQRPSMVGLLGGQRPQGTLASTIAGYTPPQMQAMSNQQVMDYARTVAQTAQQNLQNQMSDLDKALVMGQQGIQVGDREALARLMEQVPGLMGATAYHGTPHTIRGKFDISKVGTGEGAQAYGHGMYFAENPKVAQQYQTMAAKVEPEALKYNNQEILDLYNKAENAQQRAYRMPNGEAKNKAIEKANAELSVWEDVMLGKHPQVLKMNVDNAMPDDVWVAKQEFIKSLDLKKFSGLDENIGNLYKVNIPDEYIPNMLDYDKPLLEQPENVLKSLKKLNDPYINQALTTKPKLSKDGEYWEYMGNTYASKSEALEDATPQRIISGYTGLGKTPQEVSQTLNNVGIKGVKYLDQFSRTEGGGTANFVVFDPTDVKILEKNSQKVEGLLD